MTITIIIKVEDNPLDITENELSMDVAYLLEDYLHDQKIDARITINDKERRN